MSIGAPRFPWGAVPGLQRNYRLCSRIPVCCRCLGQGWVWPAVDVGLSFIPGGSPFLFCSLRYIRPHVVACA